MTPKITYIGTVTRVPWCRQDAQGNWLHEVRLSPAGGGSSRAVNGWVYDPELGETVPSRCGAPWQNVWIYKGMAFRVENDEAWPPDEVAVRIEHLILKRKRQYERIKAETAALKNLDQVPPEKRDRIPEGVQMFVWQRDRGQCVQCGGREKLEFDHIIPVVEGGSSTERNIQLLCEACNRKKEGTLGSNPMVGRPALCPNCAHTLPFCPF